MPILDAALAFALTMLVVASAVTLIVGVLRNSAKLRTDTLKEMLDEFFVKECKPVIEHEAKRISKEVDQQVADALTQALSQYDVDALKTKVVQEKIGHLSTEDLLEYLKRSNLGTTLLTKLGDKADEVFDKLGKRYEAIGTRFTESFRKNSRRWTTIVALVLALVLNIDSIFILDSYIKDEPLRQSVVAQMDVIVDQYTATLATIPDDDAVVTKETLQQAVDSTRAQIDLLKSSGFPLGWSYYPYSCLRDGFVDCIKKQSAGGWLMWFLGILLTAVLAGLGAPFWYDAIRGISSIAQQAGKGGKVAQK